MVLSLASLIFSALENKASEKLRLI